MQVVNIMIVEDEKIVAADIRNNLTNLGYAVSGILSSGEECIKKTVEQCPDLVLMDIHLKGRMDGIEAARIIQTRLHVPVVFITAFADDSTIQRAKNTEPYGYIIKPFGKKELQSTIEIALHKYGRERRLKVNEQWLMSVFRGIGEGVLAVDRSGSICIMNLMAETVTGWPLVDSLGAHWQDLWQFLDPRKCGGVKDPVSFAIAEERSFDLTDCPVRFSRTGDKILMGSIAPVRDGGGRITGAVIAFRDTTAQRNLETEYQRVRHLESLQRLAGGVAHNMNNVVAIISGYTEALVNSLEPSDPRFRDAKMIEHAGERAAHLTRQLLSFSRRQPGQPRVMDLNQHVASMEQALKHTVGARVDVRLNLTGRPALIHADPSHLEQIVMSLVLNARDAMPNAGTLSIVATTVHLDEPLAGKFVDVPPGEYALLSIGDTGCGIEFEQQSQIFEPFFTTKDREKASGLGLSTVYGLVKQAAGHVWFESEPGKTTTFFVCFPIQREDLRLAEHSASMRGGAETILVVDDDAAIRRLAVDGLRCLGYRVLEASNGQEAIQVYEQNSTPINLLITEVMLPNMTGADLACRLTALNGNLNVLFTSTYSAFALKHFGGVKDDTPLLQKPFSIQTLAARIRAALDNGVGENPVSLAIIH